jgi:hypothetical protein
MRAVSPRSSRCHVLPREQDAAAQAAYDAGALLMKGLSTLNGSLRHRDGRNEWMRELSAALHGCDARWRCSVCPLAG